MKKRGSSASVDVCLKVQARVHTCDGVVGRLSKLACCTPATNESSDATQRAEIILRRLQMWESERVECVTTSQREADENERGHGPARQPAKP